MTFNKKRISTLTILLILDALVLGGFIALLFVNRLLDVQLNDYAPRNMVAADTILNLMDHLLIYFVVYAGALVALVLVTICVWLWGKTNSRLRYAVPLIFALIIGVGLWRAVSLRSKPPLIKPQTPTPTAVPDTTPLSIPPG
ncbi:MAG: hypothetical protein JSV81_20035 [Anaerolineales bacterium]|nr:MAG: hypothetical protein JSV81_20035 [Anaerolineales bacterium]